MLKSLNLYKLESLTFLRLNGMRFLTQRKILSRSCSEKIQMNGKSNDISLGEVDKCADVSYLSVPL